MSVPHVAHPIGSHKLVYETRSHTIFFRKIWYVDGSRRETEGKVRGERPACRARRPMVWTDETREMGAQVAVTRRTKGLEGDGRR